MVEIGTILTKLRQERDLGQKELSAHFILSVGTISNYENSIHFPDLDMLQKLADYFHVTTDYLLGRTKYRHPPELLERYSTDCYAVSDLPGLVESLSPRQRAFALSYLRYLKENPIHRPRGEDRGHAGA